MPDSIETRWFKIVSFIVFGILLGILIANVIYFKRIMDNNGGGGVTKTEATWMFWLNLIFAILDAILFIWALIRLIWTREERTKAVTYLKEEGDIYRPRQVVPVQRQVVENQNVELQPVRRRVVTNAVPVRVNETTILDSATN